MNNPVIGARYRFDYPEEFTTLPEYSTHRNCTVIVLRPCTDDEADVIYEDNIEIDRMYKVQADDGWVGSAWDSELVTVT